MKRYSLNCTYYIEQGVSNYNTFKVCSNTCLKVHNFSGARIEHPEATADDRERPSLKVSKGAPHSGMNLHSVVHVGAQTQKNYNTVMHHHIFAGAH